MGAWGVYDDNNDRFLDAIGDLTTELMAQDPIAVRELEKIDPELDEAWEYEKKWQEQNAKLLGDNAISLEGSHVIGAMMYIADIGSGNQFRGFQGRDSCKMYCHPLLAQQAKRKIERLLNKPEITQKQGWKNVESRFGALRFELQIAEMMLNAPEELHYCVIDAPRPPQFS
jgi:hypothetical protein